MGWRKGGREVEILVQRKGNREHGAGTLASEGEDCAGDTYEEKGH